MICWLKRVYGVCLLTIKPIRPAKLLVPPLIPPSPKTVSAICNEYNVEIELSTPPPSFVLLPKLSKRILDWINCVRRVLRRSNKAWILTQYQSCSQIYILVIDIDNSHQWTTNTSHTSTADTDNLLNPIQHGSWLFQPGASAFHFTITNGIILRCLCLLWCMMVE